MALAVTPALKRLIRIVTHGDDTHALGAIEKILARNDLYAAGVEPPQARGTFAPSVTVQTQVNMPDAPLASMSDEDLVRYRVLLMELRALAPKDVQAPKRINSVATGS